MKRKTPPSPTPLFELEPLPLPPPPDQPEAVYAVEPFTGKEEFLGVRGGVRVPINRFREYLDVYGLEVQQVIQLPAAETMIVVVPKGNGHVGSDAST